MRLTKHSDYALRVLVYVAAIRAKNPERLVSTQEMSEAYAISTHHPVKVVGKLGKAGYLEINRGRGGGVRLARAPEDIRVGEVVAVTEPDFAFVECMQEDNEACPLTGACALVPPLEEALRAFLDALDNYTLADVIGRRGHAYRKLLNISLVR